MNESNSKIISRLPYKIKNEKNVDEIYEYLLKQSKRNKVMSMVLLSIWILFIIYYLILGDVGITVFHKFDSIVTYLQMIVLPLISFLLYKLSKKNILTREEIKVELES